MIESIALSVSLAFMMQQDLPFVAPFVTLKPPRQQTAEYEYRCGTETYRLLIESEGDVRVAAYSISGVAVKSNEIDEINEATSSMTTFLYVNVGCQDERFHGFTVWGKENPLLPNSHGVSAVWSPYGFEI